MYKDMHSVEPTPVALASTWTVYAAAAIAAGHTPKQAVEIADAMVEEEVLREESLARQKEVAYA